MAIAFRPIRTRSPSGIIAADRQRSFTLLVLAPGLLDFSLRVDGYFCLGFDYPVG